MTPHSVWERTVSRAITETRRTLGPETPRDVLAGAAAIALKELPAAYSDLFVCVDWSAAFDRVLNQVLFIEACFLGAAPEFARQKREGWAARRSQRVKN